LWIFGSDLVLFALLRDSAAVERWSVAKGIAFVTVTSLLLMLVLWRIFAALEGAFDALKASERRLSSSRAQLSAVINSAMDAIINTDSQGTVIAINPAAERMFGMSARDVLGKSVTRLLPDGVGPSTPSFLITKGVRLNGDGFPVEA